MNTRKGFTLVELLVVIAILAILATVSVVGYTSFINRAEKSNAETEAHQVESTIESFLMIDSEFVFSQDTIPAKTAGTYTKVYAVKENNEIVIKKDTIVVEEKTETVGEETVTTYPSTTTTANLDGAEVAKTTDFKDLPGTLYAVDGQLRYVYDLGANNTADADDAHVVIK